MNALLVALLAIASSLGFATLLSACMLSSHISQAEEAGQTEVN